MFEIAVEAGFAAAHQLRGYQGKCEKLHGHNYQVQVVVEGPRLDEAGLLVDFVEVKRLLRAVLETLDHGYLNQIPPFDALNPTAENIARYIAEEMARRLAALSLPEGARLAAVKVWETATSTATYRP